MQRDRHLASGDLCRESTPFGERFAEFHMSFASWRCSAAHSAVASRAYSD
jgi:hypothetical protein